MSMTQCKYDKLNVIGKAWIKIGSSLGLIYVKEIDDGMIELNNLTNLNLTLKVFGSMSEERLTTVLLLEQLVGCAIALGILTNIVHFFYRFESCLSKNKSHSLSVSGPSLRRINLLNVKLKVAVLQYLRCFESPEVPGKIFMSYFYKYNCAIQLFTKC